MIEFNRRRFLAVLAAAPLIAKADAIAEALKPVIYPAWPKWHRPLDLAAKQIPGSMLHVADAYNFQKGDLVNLFSSSFEGITAEKGTFIVEGVDAANGVITLT